MAFNTRELEVIKYGVQNGKSRAEVEDALTRLRTGLGAKKAPEPIKREGFLETIKDIPSDIGEAFGGAVESVTKGIESADTARTQVEQGKISPLAGTIKTIGGGLSAGAGVIGQGLIGLGKLFTSPFREQAIAGGVAEGAKAIAESEPVKALVQKYETLSPEQKATVDGFLGTAEGLATLFGTAPATKALRVGVDETVGAVRTGVSRVGEVAGKVGETIQPVVQGVTDVAKMTAGGASRIPGRIATNVAEKQAIEATIAKLPTKVAQQAARDGIDVADVSAIYQIPAKVKPTTKELVDTAIKFAKKETDVDPIEVVGKPIVARMKELESLKGSVGQKLGEVAKKLGVVTKEEVTQPVFDALKKVRGLEGLTVNKDGVLNFKNTVLTTVETAADRKAIQSIFTQATKWGSGEAKHKLRQELFEILGGKKKAGVQLTETQDKAYQAIRQGLADVLDKKNPVYKDLNMQFAKIAQPLADLRKSMQAIPGVSEDILDMSAGLLARRLTSTSISQGKIRAILDAMDNVTKVKGNLRETMESMQKLYNILGKYYDLAPSTGFQGQVKAGLESARGLSDVVVGAVRGVAGETSAVRQKAIESAIREALGN